MMKTSMLKRAHLGTQRTTQRRPVRTTVYEDPERLRGSSAVHN